MPRLIRMPETGLSGLEACSQPPSGVLVQRCSLVGFG